MTEKFDEDTDWLVRKMCHCEKTSTLSGDVILYPDELIAAVHDYVPKDHEVIQTWRIDRCPVIPSKTGSNVSPKRKFDDTLECCD